MWKHILLAAAGLLSFATPGFAQEEAAEASGPTNPCPVRCSISGPNPLNWTYLHGVEALNRCEEPMLFSIMLKNRLNDPEKHITIRSCTSSEKNTRKAPEYDPVPFTFGGPEKRAVVEKEAGCASDMAKSSNKTELYYHEWLPDSTSEVAFGNIDDTALALDKIKDYLADEHNCQRTIIFSKVRYSIAGLFVGYAVDRESVGPVVERLSTTVKDKRAFEAGRFAAQTCRGPHSSSWGFGVVADLQGNITSVQEALAGWSEGKCLGGADTSAYWVEADIDFWHVKNLGNSTSNSTSTSISNSTAAAAPRLHRRADCRSEEVFEGDTCYELAQRCGISLTQLQNLNKGTDFCNKLKPRQHVCCTTGDVPDFRPKPDANGMCHSIDIKEDDGCWDIADAHYLTVKDIEDLNKKTWGFAGCDDLQPGQKICLSKGEPPMPNPITNAICGPQKPNGEERGDKDLADMNPCPLNVCCNVWGQCGMDNDFCVKNPAKTGAPGTSLPGKNGCISNCGMNITNNDKGPASFSHIAYFEAWNKNRPCLNMDVTDIDTKKYTHIHFAFPDVTANDFKIDVSKLKTQFDMMKKMTGIKRIISLGGWAFSAEAPTYTIFREAVKPANRATFAANVVSFVNEHGLDGIDFDWEYPAAEDLPGIPSANPLEGQDYLEFLKLVKRRLPDKSVSIASPASYWYLRGFPIKEIAKVVDYIVYMTYDLHGQWDHGNKWSSPGCPNGDCLRSHINLTETMTSLAMVTKAGVPSYKVFVGIASYGRSFKMSKAGCTGPMCTFTGTRNDSDALAGPCTDTSGYISSAEIREVLWNKDLLGAKEWHDKETDSDYVVYRDTEWVAWMNDDTKKSRIDLYKGLNFGGVSDWAVDLDKDYGDSGIGEGDDDDTSMSGGKNCPLSKTYTDLEALANDDGVADDCKPVLALNILEQMLDKSLKDYEDVDNGYDKNFAAYQRVMKENAEAAMYKFGHWRDGKYAEWFDCDFKDLDDSKRNFNGPCDQMVRDRLGGAYLKGVMSVKITIRDEEGFYEALAEETGIIEDWVDLNGEYKQNTEPGSNCQPPPPPGQTCPALQYILSVTGVPTLKKDFEIPNPKDMIKDVQGNLDAIRTDISSRFFDVVAGIWDGGNADVLQVLSVPIFFLSQAVTSMEEAKKTGGEILEKERENLILNIISALLFFLPFVGQFAAMAAGAATVARLIALGGMLGNTAFSIADIVGNPENAAMAIMALLSAGRVRKPRDFLDLGAARRAQTKAGVTKMGATFKKHDDSLQKVVGNCRKDGGKDDDEPNMCDKKNKRDRLFTLDQFTPLEPRDVPHLAFMPVEVHEVHEVRHTDITVLLEKRAPNNCPATEKHETTTTSTSTFMTTPPVTCKKEWTQACYHYSSVMSVHTNTPDMVRWTCWATADTSKDGKATDDWGWFGSRAGSFPQTAQHWWEWGKEWTEHNPCEKDEWPPRMFWGQNAVSPLKKEGQLIRLIPREQNGRAGDMWKQFCQKHDEFKNKKGGKTETRPGAATTTSSKVDRVVKGGTTTFITSVGVKVPNAVFEIKHWEHTAANGAALPDDGLWDNPCWPSILLPNDPGFALLTDDAWYRNHPQAAINTVLYSEAPPNAVTSGKTKSRRHGNRPLIAPRSLLSPEAIYSNTAAAAETCTVEGGMGLLRRRSYVDEDGVAYEEVLPSDVDRVDWDNVDLSALKRLPALSLPLAAEAVPSAVVEVEVVVVEGATPGSAIVAGLAEPTMALV